VAQEGWLLDDADATQVVIAVVPESVRKSKVT
jgi:hypothetical protein